MPVNGITDGVSTPKLDAMLAFVAAFFSDLTDIMRSGADFMEVRQAEVEEDLMQHVPKTQSRVAHMAQIAAVKTIGGGLVGVALVVVILNEVFTLDIINNTTGPFAGTIDTVESIGTGAIAILVLSFLILAGAVAMRYMDRF